MDDAQRPRPIVVTGAGGLMGRYLVTGLRARGWEVQGYFREDLDIRDGGAFAEMIGRVRPEIVINAAGLVSFVACERDPDLSRAINLDAPLSMATECDAARIPFWQFSSDYVFDGNSDRPYTETDDARPLSVYARHKAQLEESMTRFERHLVLRVSWVYGVGGKTFMSLLPGLFLSQEEVSVASGKRGSSLYAWDGAEMIARLVGLRPAGLLNLVNAGETSWEAFARALLEAMRRARLPVRCERIVEVPYRQIPALAGNRPEYSILSTERLSGLLPGGVPDWRQGMERFVSEFVGLVTSRPVCD